MLCIELKYIPYIDEALVANSLEFICNKVVTFIVINYSWR